jgi:hypothetical protein
MSNISSDITDKARLSLRSCASMMIFPTVYRYYRIVIINLSLMLFFP